MIAIGVFERGQERAKPMCCQQRAEQPGGGRCATYDTTVRAAVTIKTSAKIIAVCFIIVSASSTPSPARTRKVRDWLLRQLKVRIASKRRF